MDYKRIYEDFIKARREMEPTLVGYTERHHIVPRSLGGGNEPENLIRLTPEDHFFAHLLLAKMHGGKMRAALFCMLQRTEQHWGRRHASRGRYGLARRMALPALSKRWLGKLNPLFNATKYQWVNYRTGVAKTATLSEMHRDHGASRASWTSVANGDRPSIKGWLLSSALDAHKPSEKGQSFTFVNRDGRVFTGTQGEFARAHKINLATASRVVRHESVTRCGWRLSGVKDRPHGFAKDGLPARARRPARAEISSGASST